MFQLPTINHPARELMGDVAQIAAVLDPAQADRLPAIWQARKSAERAFQADSAIRRVCYVVLRIDSGDRWLVSFGRKGGWKREWNFGGGV